MGSGLVVMQKKKVIGAASELFLVPRNWSHLGTVILPVLAKPQGIKALETQKVRQHKSYDQSL